MVLVLTFDGFVVSQNLSGMNQFQVACWKFGIRRFLRIQKVRKTTGQIERLSVGSTTIQCLE